MSGNVAADLSMLVLAGLLLWAAVGDIRTFTIPNELNALIALAAPLSWWAAGADVWPDAATRLTAPAIDFVPFDLAISEAPIRTARLPAPHRAARVS